VAHSLKEICSAEQQTNILNTMLEDYQKNILHHTRLFSGIAEVLNLLEDKGIKWGVVTNKRKRFTNPLMDALKLTSRAACIISGDSTPNSKPHPEPMLTACKQAGVEPTRCIYIGDSAHDIEAGKKVGMKTMAAAYGYLKFDDDPQTWHADALIHSPAEILPWINNALCH
jgi:phosphoglycolate phosphatase